MDNTTPRSTSTEPLWPGFAAGVLPPADPLSAGARPVVDAHTPAAWPASGSHELAALRHVMRCMSALDDPASAVRTSLEVALEVTGANLGSLWLVQSDGSMARSAAVGLSAEYLQAFAADPGWQASQQALLAGSEVVLIGLDAPRMSTIVQPQLGSSSVVMIPLHARGMRAGGFVLCHPEPRWFERFSSEFLHALGESLAAALDDARRLEELRASNELHTGLLRAAQDAILYVNSDGCITEVNPALESMLGYTREELIGKPFDAFTLPAQFAPLREAVSLLLREGVPIVGLHKTCITAAGEHVPSTLHATRHVDSQGEVRIVALVRDERRRLEAERQVRDTQALLALMLAHVPAGVALLRVEGLRVLEHNAAFASLIAGRDGGRFAGRSLAELIPGLAEGDLGGAIRRALETGETVSLAETPAPCATDLPGFWSVTVAPLAPGSGGPCDRFVLTLGDVSERRALEERYRHAQKLEAVGTLAGGFAHEFNNLLTAILGNVSLALLDLPPTHEVVAGLRDCESAAQRAAELTRQLLGLSRRSPMRPVPCDLREVMRDALVLIQRSFDPRILIQCEMADDLWRVRADVSHLSQLLVNLSLNARDAMPEGGTLRVSARNTCSLAAPGAQMEVVMLEVSDTGAGMTADVLARMYEPFFTTKGPDRGTGLGLSVAHGIVEQHGGWLECESRAGHGTTFRVFLPRLEATPAPAGAAGRGELVLVVDDEPVLRGLARSVLERHGFRAEVAADGVEALERIRQGLQPALVLLDQTMPRLSGRQTLALLRELAPGVAVVLTSGYEPGSGPEDALTGPQADAFLPKPYAPERLASFVREVLDSRSQAADTTAAAPPMVPGPAARLTGTAAAP